MSDNKRATQRRAIPRNEVNDYTRESASSRRAFVREQTDADLSHVAKYSFGPSLLQGNIENFIGVAQVPIGVAGPLRINGEHAQGDFLVPFATTEVGIAGIVATFDTTPNLDRDKGGLGRTHCRTKIRKLAGWVKVSTEPERPNPETQKNAPCAIHCASTCVSCDTRS